MDSWGYCCLSNRHLSVVTIFIRHRYLRKIISIVAMTTMCYESSHFYYFHSRKVTVTMKWWIRHHWSQISNSSHYGQSTCRIIYIAMWHFRNRYKNISIHVDLYYMQCDSIPGVLLHWMIIYKNHPNNADYCWRTGMFCTAEYVYELHANT